MRAKRTILLSRVDKRCPGQTTCSSHLFARFCMCVCVYIYEAEAQPKDLNLLDILRMCVYIYILKRATISIIVLLRACRQNVLRRALSFTAIVPSS